MDPLVVLGPKSENTRLKPTLLPSLRAILRVAFLGMAFRRFFFQGRRRIATHTARTSSRPSCSGSARNDVKDPEAGCLDKAGCLDNTVFLCVQTDRCLIS